MSHRSHKVRTLLAFTAVALLAATGTAWASGTGVNLTSGPPPLSGDEARAHWQSEADFQSWLGADTTRLPGHGPNPPCYYLTTPSHRQVNGYYCGPATCQIIDDFWGAYESQATYANSTYRVVVDGIAYNQALCPDSGGSYYWLLDNCLRRYTGRDYDYYGGIGTDAEFYSRVQYGLGTKHYPESALVRIDADVWRNYNYDHVGHIVCIEAFDWQLTDGDYRTIRLNDCFSEADAYASGGDTYGHTVYPRGQIWAGVKATSGRAMIY
jgi:hypothetical protein